MAVDADSHAAIGRAQYLGSGGEKHPQKPAAGGADIFPEFEKIPVITLDSSPACRQYS